MAGAEATCSQRCATVVGGGPAGLAAALTLHARGWNVDVFEKRDDPCAEDPNKVRATRRVHGMAHFDETPGSLFFLARSSSFVGVRAFVVVVRC